VSRVGNADEFLIRFQGIRVNYDRIFRLRVAQIREKYAGRPEEGLIDQSLEAHARAYIVNDFLAALNWRLNQKPEDGLPNLIPEAPIRSAERGNIRFLDYLGLETNTANPLLVVETKRPSSSLPGALKPAATYSEIVSRGLGGERLSGEWNTWLKDLRDYVRSVHANALKAPRRVVITNGDWLIVFLDPSDALLDGGSKDPSRILAFSNSSYVERRHREVFECLEHGRVLGEAPSLSLGELPFYVERGAVDRAMHGVHLRYIEQKTIYRNSPVIIVAPVVFIRLRFGGWLRVEAPPQEHEVPRDTNKLVQHLSEFEQAANELLEEVTVRLGISLEASPLSGHYADEDGFQSLSGVAEIGINEYLVVTGDKTHYLMQMPSVPDCPYHDWNVCNTSGIACNPGPIVARSISPRSFFFSGESHHCAHRDVSSAKAAQITDANRSLCGSRSGHAGQAFCEIWRFEQYLCCQTCVFEEVCSKTTVFQLPCPHKNDTNEGS